MNNKYDTKSRRGYKRDMRYEVFSVVPCCSHEIMMMMTEDDDDDNDFDSRASATFDERGKLRKLSAIRKLSPLLCSDSPTLKT